MKTGQASDAPCPDPHSAELGETTPVRKKARVAVVKKKSCFASPARRSPRLVGDKDIVQQASPIGKSKLSKRKRVVDDTYNPASDDAHDNDDDLEDNDYDVEDFEATDHEVIFCFSLYTPFFFVSVCVCYFSDILNLVVAYVCT